MRFRFEGEIAASPEATLRTWHERLEEIAGRLPNVARVEEIERTSERTRMRWFAKGDIPRAFHKVISPEDLFWEDEGEWDPVEHRVVFHIHRPGLRSVRCETTFAFEPHGIGSTYRCDGELRIDVPLLGAMLERFFVGHTESNLKRFLELVGEEAAITGDEPA